MKYTSKEMLEHIKKEKLEVGLLLALFANTKDYAPMIGKIRKADDGFVFDILNNPNKPKLLENFMKEAMDCKSEVKPAGFSRALNAELNDDFTFKERKGKGMDLSEAYEAVDGRTCCVVYANDKFYLVAETGQEKETAEEKKCLFEHIMLDFIKKNGIDTKGRLKAVLETAAGQYKNFYEGQKLQMAKGAIKKL